MPRLVSKEKLEMAKLLIEKNGVDLVEDSVLKNLKLGQLEDIEEELGIDLITLFKALKDGIWVKYDADFGFTGKPKIVIEKDKCTEICLRKKKWWIQENDFLLKDYGKTWALTQEELTNAK